MKSTITSVFIILFGSINAQVIDSLQVKDSIRILNFDLDTKHLRFNSAYMNSYINQEEYNGIMLIMFEESKKNEQREKTAESLQNMKLSSLLQFSISIDGKENEKKFQEDIKKQEFQRESSKSIQVATFQESNKEENNERIFGPSQYDSRIEPLQLTSEIYWQKKILNVSESVGIIIEKEKLFQTTSTIYQLDISAQLGQVFNLCKDEAFYSQPTTGVGTCFVYSDNSLLTANHVFERPLHHYVVVFGYKILNKNGVVDLFVDKENIYYPKAVVKNNTNLDIVEFSVDRKINRPSLEWENSKLLNAAKSEIYMIGYPTGLPMKIALNASITENDHSLYYYTSLDSFQGNSGSPVFNFYTHKVIGVLVSGEIDYKFNGNCFNSPLCKYPYCKGEKVIRIEEIIKQF